MPKGTCSIDTCPDVVRAHGLCDNHYYRLRKYNDPLGGRPIILKDRRPAEERFWKKVDKNGPIPDYAPHLGCCWVWLAGLKRRPLQTDGQYAEFDHGYAHIFAYESVVGPVPDGLDLDHLCRVRHCVRPSHLDPCPRKENLRRGREARSA